MADDYVPWWVPQDHPRRKEDDPVPVAVAVPEPLVNPTPLPDPAEVAP